MMLGYSVLEEYALRSGVRKKRHRGPARDKPENPVEQAARRIRFHIRRSRADQKPVLPGSADRAAL